MTDAERLAEKIGNILFGDEEIPESAMRILAVAVIESRPMKDATAEQLNCIMDELVRALNARNAALRATRMARWRA